MYGWVKSDHGFGHGVTGGIGVKAATDLIALLNEGREPAGIGSGTGGGEATILGMESQATDGVNGRLAEDDG